METIMVKAGPIGIFFPGRLCAAMNIGKMENHDDDDNKNNNNDDDGDVFLLPLHVSPLVFQGLMMGSSSSGFDWPQTKSQIITNITAHYKRSLSSSLTSKNHNNKNNAFTFSDLLDRANDFLSDASTNAALTSHQTSQRAKDPSPPHLRFSTYDNVATTEDSGVIASTVTASMTNSQESDRGKAPFVACTPTEQQRPSSRVRREGHVRRDSGDVKRDGGGVTDGSGGNQEEMTATTRHRSRPGSVNFWSTQRQRSRGPSVRDSNGLLDENAEWEEIEKIMSSFGAGIVRHSVFEQEGYEQQISRHLSTQGDAPSAVPTALETASTTSSSAGLWSVSSASGLSSGSSSSGVHDSSSSTVGTADQPRLSDVSSYDASIGQTSQRRLSDFLRPPSTIHDWLMRIGLVKYEKVFVDNGFDDPAFLDCIEEQDLVKIGVVDFEHRMELLQAVAMTSIIDSLDENFPGTDISIENWLSSLNLLMYHHNFIRAGIDDMEKASKMISEGRLNAVGVISSGHQKRMTHSLWRRYPRPSNTSSNASSDSLGFEDCFPRKLSSDSDVFERNLLVLDQKRRNEERSALIKMAALYQDKAHASQRQFVDAELDENRKALDAIAAELNKFENSIPPPSPTFTALGTQHSRYELKKKDIPLLREPSFAVLNEDEKPFIPVHSFDGGYSLSSATDSSGSTSRKDVHSSTLKKKHKKKISPEDLSIRPPHQAQSPNQQPHVQKWCHPPETLLKSSCDYNAFYLGSTLINNLQENESIIKSIKKIKTSTENIVKLPSITLSISYRGVCFRDSTTSIAICDHEIRNIHCAAQDDDDLKFLAYITKDVHVDKHFCHVFKAPTLVSASEIILTLGQAFEVAYQLATKMKMRTSATSLSAASLRRAEGREELRETSIIT